MQSDLLKLAQQGDPEAIARWLNRSLQPRGVTAKVLLRDDCLKVLLASARPLEQQAFVQFLQQQLGSLGSESIKLVKVYSQQWGENEPAWVQEFPLQAAASSNGNGRSAPNSAPSSNAVNSNSADSIPAIPKPIAPAGAIVKISNALVPYSGDRRSKRSFWATLRSFRFETILPYRDVFSLDLYQHYAVKLLLFLGLFPLIVNLVSEQVSMAQTTWLLGIYYACIWGVVLHDLIKPVQFSWGNTVKSVLFTAFIGIPILLLFQRVPPFNALYHAISDGGIVERLLGFVFGVGVLEETCKALPIYLLLRSNKLTDPRTSAFYGAMSGLGFAIAEGAAYSLRYAFGFSQGHLGLGSFVAANTIRFVSLPLFHAILAGIVGYFIGLAAINPSRQIALILIGLAIAAVLHGLYNTFAGSFAGLFIIAFTILLFVSYLRRSRQMVDEMQQAEQEKR
ncbi:PrsW family intramembrane metalloprotease [Phormidium tenue FACHB-886]|nr:PrsW family intramembrane metalloprotease [Phormidium tenue FACHB-886]